jgi:hypothetical protein
MSETEKQPTKCAYCQMKIPVWRIHRFYAYSLERIRYEFCCSGHRVAYNVEMPPDKFTDKMFSAISEIRFDFKLGLVIIVSRPRKIESTFVFPWAKVSQPEKIQSAPRKKRTKKVDVDPLSATDADIEQSIKKFGSVC